MTNYTDEKSNATNNLVLEAVRGLPQLEGKTLIHLSVGGSRSKGIAGGGSDYDVKAIILHSASDYLLQNITPSKAFKTFIIDPETDEEVEVEGTLVDFLTMQKYAITCNQAAYLALLGNVIYQTAESKELEQLFLQAYNPRTLLQSFQGILRHEQKKAKKSAVKIKEIANIVYYASIVHLFSSRKEPPSQDAFQILECIQMEAGLREEIIFLYRQRIMDKTKSGVSLEPFRAFVEQALNLDLPGNSRNNHEIKTLQAEANRTFLAIMHATAIGQ